MTSDLFWTFLPFIKIIKMDKYSCGEVMMWKFGQRLVFYREDEMERRWVHRNVEMWECDAEEEKRSRGGRRLFVCRCGHCQSLVDPCPPSLFAFSGLSRWPHYGDVQILFTALTAGSRRPSNSLQIHSFSSPLVLPAAVPKLPEHAAVLNCPSLKWISWLLDLIWKHSLK